MVVTAKIIPICFSKKEYSTGNLSDYDFREHSIGHESCLLLLKMRFRVWLFYLLTFPSARKMYGRHFYKTLIIFKYFSSFGLHYSHEKTRTLTGFPSTLRTGAA